MRAHSRCAAQIHDLCETNENEREIFWLDLALIRRYGGNLTLNSLFSIRKWFMLMTFRLDHLLKLFYYYCNTRDIQLTCWSIYLNVFIYLFFPNSMFSCWKVHCSIYVFRALILAMYRHKMCNLRFVNTKWLYRIFSRCSSFRYLNLQIVHES